MKFSRVLLAFTFSAVMLQTGCASQDKDASQDTELTLMSFNMWGAGANDQKSIDETVAAIKASGADIKSESDADAQFVMGDFNEPSHRDWTQRAVDAGHQPLVVEYPTVKAVEAEGFVDTFRTAFPDEVAKPGITWTPTSEPTDPEDHHDRIDFILAKAQDLTVDSAGVVGEKEPEADLVVTPWPSDHRAVMAVVTFQPTS